MGKQSLTLMLVAAVLTVKASSQEIVIEPTNGRAPASNHLSRPAAEQPASAQPKKLTTKPAAKSADSERAQAKKANQSAAKREAAPVETKPSVAVASEAAGSEAVEATPAPKKARWPGWAMADTRDAASLQNEIAGALAHDPTLAGSEIRVSVDDSSVTLEGRAAGSQHLQAQRLAKSYAWNRKLVDHILVDHTEALPKMAAQR